MKALAAFILVLALAGCGGGGEDQSEPAAPAASTKPTTTAMTTDFTKFTEALPVSLDRAVWQDKIVHNESFLPIVGKSEYPMLRDIVKVIAVRDRKSGRVYDEGPDYSVNALGHLVIPTTSAIPQLPADWINQPGPVYPLKRADGSYIRVVSDYQYHQLSVTYEGGPYNGFIATGTGAVKTLAKLRNGQKIAITAKGDSITYGSDSTWELNIEPKQPGYAMLVAQHLASLWPSQVYFRNKAVGGTTSNNGALTATADLADTPSDLVILAYGMNDAGIRYSADSYKANLRTMIAAARSVNPDVEIALVCSWPNNPEVSPNNWDMFAQYYMAINTIAYDTPGVIVVNVTSPVWDYILNRKTFYDITANGINHPSDWMASVYAQIVSKRILGE